MTQKRPECGAAWLVSGLLYRGPVMEIELDLTTWGLGFEISKVAWRRLWLILGPVQIIIGRRVRVVS